MFPPSPKFGNSPLAAWAPHFLLSSHTWQSELVLPCDISEGATMLCPAIPSNQAPSEQRLEKKKWILV